MMEQAGLVEVTVETERFSLLFKSAREFFFAPVIEYGPLRTWKALAGKGQEMQDVFWSIKEAIDAYFGDVAFSVSVVAGCITGIKRVEPEPVEVLDVDELSGIRVLEDEDADLEERTTAPRHGGGRRSGSGDQPAAEGEVDEEDLPTMPSGSAPEET